MLIRKAVHFGVGGIGRGLIAEHLFTSGYEIVFVAIREGMVQQLQLQKAYNITHVGAHRSWVTTITNYSALNSATNRQGVVQEVATADVVTCAVRLENLGSIAPIIAEGLDKRSGSLPPLVVIACENGMNATDMLANHIRREKAAPHADDQARFTRAHYANAIIDRVVPAQTESLGLDLVVESFGEWVVDQTPFIGGALPVIKGVKWVENLAPFAERKLYTMNTCHSAAAYLGHYHGLATIHEAASCPPVMSLIRRVAQEVSELISIKHEILRPEQSQYAATILERICNPFLKDTIKRVGRSPLRKLRRCDRLIGPAAELAERGMSCSALLAVAEAALWFRNIDGDGESRELALMLETKSPREVARQVCRLEPDHRLFDQVVKIVARVQAGERREN